MSRPPERPAEKEPEHEPASFAKFVLVILIVGGVLTFLVAGTCALLML
jgi:hypothetical protein